ncbi:MAG: YlmC/YmxH family sporulation protein [Firmicutes bacterium]|nr:YlmC/YmxH family sporulation protein [Bacillota bacterium]
MLLSEIGDKEIVDLVHGTMHGKLWDAEMIFDETTGSIKSLVIPQLGGMSTKFKDNIYLPWNSIVIIGKDMIIFRSN